MHASIKEMLFSKPTAILYTIAVFSVFTGFFILNQYKLFGVLNGIDNDKFLATVGSIGFVFSMLRFIWSWSLDKSTFKIVFGVLLSL